MRFLYHEYYLNRKINNIPVQYVLGRFSGYLMRQATFIHSGWICVEGQPTAHTQVETSAWNWDKLLKETHSFTGSVTTVTYTWVSGHYIPSVFNTECLTLTYSNEKPKSLFLWLSKASCSSWDSSLQRTTFHFLSYYAMKETNQELGTLWVGISSFIAI